MHDRRLPLALDFVVVLSAVEESHAPRDIRGEPQQRIGPLEVAPLQQIPEAPPRAPAEDQRREVSAPAGALELDDLDSLVRSCLRVRSREQMSRCGS